MRKTLIKLVPIVLFFACTREVKPDVQRTEATVEEKQSAIIPGSYIVQFDGDYVNQAPELLGALEEARIERIFPDAGEWEARHREAGLHCWYRILFDSPDLQETKAEVSLGGIPGVVYAAPERRMQSTAYFNDPLASQQWALFNDGSIGSNYVAGYDINVLPVWENYTAGSSDVIVAVIDGGVQLNHPDLQAVTIPGGSDGSKSFVYNHEGFSIPADNHGTHVAGIIAAVNNNEVGISGIAGGEDGKGGVKILSCAIFMEDPSDPEKSIQGDSYNALVWAADHGAVIANNSWGYVYDTETDAMAGSVGAMGPAIEYFIKNAGCDKDGNQLPNSPMKGGVVIFAAGNEQYRMAWPAAYESVIAVGAFSSKGTRSYYSNYGDWVDICAPGGDAQLGPVILSTVAGGGYGNMQGTSMACPQVTGVAALIASYFGGPGFTAEMLKERLLKGADVQKAPALAKIGPVVDAMGAFTYGGVIPPQSVKEFTITPRSNNLNVTWKVTEDEDDAKAFGYLVLASERAEDFQDINPKAIPSSVRSVVCEVGMAQLGETMEATISGLSFEANYYVALIAYDYQHNYSELSPVKMGTTESNKAPIIQTDYSGDWKVLPFETLRVNFAVSDPDGHAFSISVNPGSEAFIFQELTNGYQVTIRGNGAPSGNYTAHIVATDEYGASTDLSIPYVLEKNHAPVVVKQVGNVIMSSLGEKVVLNMTEYMTDEDGEKLSYQVEISNKQAVHASPEGETVIVTALSYGASDVIVTGSDAMGEAVSVTFKVLVRNADLPIQAYPSQVKDIVYVSNAELNPVSMTVSIVSSTGGKVFEGTVQASAFEPASIDLSKCAPGVYSLSASYAENSFKQTIVKL